MTEKHFCSMDDLLKRRMYTVIVRECRAAGLPRPVDEVSSFKVPVFYVKLFYKPCRRHAGVWDVVFSEPVNSLKDAKRVMWKLERNCRFDGHIPRTARIYGYDFLNGRCVLRAEYDFRLQEWSDIDFM